MQRIPFSVLAALAAIFVTAPAAASDDESKALAVLTSDADTYAKAMACDSLGRVGTAKSVPVLAGLLDDGELHDYARDGLERIPDPAAGKALLAALGTLRGDLLLGVIMTLGDRGEVAAVPALTAMAKGDDVRAAGAALFSLAQIATEDAGSTILDVLGNGDPETRISAARAALAAAGRMEEDGSSEVASKLRAAVSGADDLPEDLKKAAAREPAGAEK